MDRTAGRGAHLAAGDRLDPHIVGQQLGRPNRGRVVAARDKSFRLATETDEFDIPYENLVRGNLIDEE